MGSNSDRSAASELEPQRVTANVGAAGLTHDALGLGARDLGEGEALEHPDVANRLAIERGGRGDRVDDVRWLQAGGPSTGDDQLGCGTVDVRGDAGLGMAARP